MFRIKLAAVLLMVVAVVGGSLVGTVHAAGKVAFVIDVGGKALWGLPAQKIGKFALPDALIRLYSPDALRAVFSLAKLLPHSCTAEHLN